MKSTLEYLCEQRTMAWHNRLCYSETYNMNTPKEGQEAQFAESVRDCEIVDELIEIVKSTTKADPADSQQSQVGILAYEATNADMIQAIDCMTQHIMVFRAQSTHGKTADFAEPCQTCCNAKSCSFDWVSVMHPLLTQSSVQVSMVDSEH